MAVIEEEAPVTEWLLIKRVINSFNIWKAGSSIRTYMERILSGMDLDKTLDDDAVIYWKVVQDPASYSLYRLFGRDELACRDALQVPAAEFANAMLAVLKKQSVMTADELKRETAQLMGYTRMGSNVSDKVNQALKLNVKYKRIKISADSCILR